jgi:hypothetical protein
MKSAHSQNRNHHMIGTSGEDTFDFVGSHHRSDLTINGRHGDDTVIVYSDDEVAVNLDGGVITVKGMDNHDHVEWMLVLKHVEHIEVHHI